MAESRRLDLAAKAMITAVTERRSVLPVLKRLCPEVYQQIRRDGKTPGLFSFWGRCLNVDENVNEVIVHPAILQAIGTLAGESMRGQFVHAGLQHTYGYLFSLVETPYGAKRDRWVSPTLARGFGLERTLLSSRPKEGTLLANLTWFLGRIIYGPDPRYATRLKRIVGAVAGQLLDYDIGRLSACRLAEQVILVGPKPREVWLITDLVPFLHPPSDPKAVNTLLIYSVQNGRSAPIKMITAFPVTPETANAIIASLPPRGVGAIHLRYNAYLPGLHRLAMVGRRSLFERSLKTE